MSFVQINPEYETQMKRIELATPDALLGLAGTICNGHPDRNVSHVALESIGSAFLKKEHRVRRRDRLQNFAAGFGFVSQSTREAVTLQRLRSKGIACPQMIAYGESNRQAFLLLKKIEDVVDLRCALMGFTDKQRQTVLRRLGETLAYVHRVGFTHPDLCCKHIVIENVQPHAVHILDWQRSRQKSRLGLSVRSRDLAFLNATLSSDLLTDRERGIWLRAYCESFDANDASRFLAAVDRHTKRLLGKRRIRELRDHPVLTDRQTLTPVDGRSMWTTESFRGDWGVQPSSFESELTYDADCAHRRTIARRENRVISLQRFLDDRPWRWLWSCLRRRKVVSTAMKQAAAIFRLERYGIPVPRLLVVGERCIRPWRTESFIAMELPAQTMPLDEWLRQRGHSDAVTRQIEAMTIALHNAGFVADDNPFHVTADGNVMIGDVGPLRRDRANRTRKATQLIIERKREQKRDVNCELERVTIGGDCA